MQALQHNVVRFCSIHVTRFKPSFHHNMIQVFGASVEKQVRSCMDSFEASLMQFNSYQLPLVLSFTHSFIHSFIRSFIHAFIPSFVHSFIHSFIPFMHVMHVMHSCMHAFLRACMCMRVCVHAIIHFKAAQFHSTPFCSLASFVPFMSKQFNSILFNQVCSMQFH